MWLRLAIKNKKSNPPWRQKKGRIKSSAEIDEERIVSIVETKEKKTEMYKLYVDILRG